MDQAYAKAVAAIQPFVYEATTTKNPSTRYLSDLITRATSASGTYIFTELLQVPSIQSLRNSEGESSHAHLVLLEIFSWGTYEEYTNTPNLPKLNEGQAEKLRQLSILTLASPFAPVTNSNQTSYALTYSSLLQSLSLTSTAALESLLTTSIYASLITARLSPTSNPPTVHVTSVAPLRDLRPQSLPAILEILATWESRCASVVNELEGQIQTIRDSAVKRNTLNKKRQDVVDASVVGTDLDKITGTHRLHRNRLGNKREFDEQMEGEDGEYASSDDVRMEVDEGLDISGARGGGAAGSSRGAKRNRGRG